MTACRPHASIGTHGEPDRDVILKVEHVGKKFAYSVQDTMRYGTGRIFRELLGLRVETNRLRSGEFWAVDDVSFELKRGETLGIIGSNGAGKSTLLKLINGIFLPDKGRIAVRGTVGGLIEIGAGFQPKLSGRDNIYIIASVLGFSRQQIAAMVDEIIEFADLGKFIDSPVQTYSSGMQVRLGFAIHVFQKPDILLADEVLAVGDFEFQQKCLAKVNEVRKDLGMILVAHSMPTIVRFCDRAVALHNGRQIAEGRPQECIRELRLALTSSVGSAETAAKHTVAGISHGVSLPEGSQRAGAYAGAKPIADTLYGEQYWNRERVGPVMHRWVSKHASLGHICELYDAVELYFSFCLTSEEEGLIIGVPVYTAGGVMVTSFNTDGQGTEIPISADGLISGSLIIPRLSLNPGRYVTVMAIVAGGTEYLYRQVVGPLEIVPLLSMQGGQDVFFGYYSEAHSWSFSKDASRE